MVQATETTQPAAYSNKTGALPPGLSPPYSREAPEQPMTRLQRLVVENMELKEQLAIERDHVNKCRAWADELGRGVDALGMAVRMLKEELVPQQPMQGPAGCPGALTPLETSTGSAPTPPSVNEIGKADGGFRHGAKRTLTKIYGNTNVPVYERLTHGDNHESHTAPI